MLHVLEENCVLIWCVEGKCIKNVLDYAVQKYCRAYASNTKSNQPRAKRLT
jgi:hypothetical protein